MVAISHNKIETEKNILAPFSLHDNKVAPFIPILTVLSPLNTNDLISGFPLWITYTNYHPPTVSQAQNIQATWLSILVDSHLTKKTTDYPTSQSEGTDT